MLKRTFIGLFLAAAIVPTTLLAKPSALQIYIDSAEIKYATMRLMAQTINSTIMAAVYDGKPSRLKNDPKLQELHKNIDAEKKEMSRLFDRARKQLSTNRPALIALKDLHAYWMGSANNVLQEDNESARKAGISERVERLKIETRLK